MAINRIILNLILINCVLLLNRQGPVNEQTAVSPPLTTTTTTAVPAVPSPKPLATETDIYLRNLFCQDDLCSGSDYAQWIIVDAISQWQVEELQMVRHVLSQSIAALDEVGLNGRSLIAGYRFRRFNGPYVEAQDGLIGLVRHNTQEIILADTAFQRMQGFYIYHELGHVVDRQTRRQFSESYHHIAYGGYQIMDDLTPEQWETAHGYWLRVQGRDDREEATADAFALWVTSAQTDVRKPIFANMPSKVYYSSIIWTVDTSLTAIKNDEIRE